MNGCMYACMDGRMGECTEEMCTRGIVALAAAARLADGFAISCLRQRARAVSEAWWVFV